MLDGFPRLRWPRISARCTTHRCGPLNVNRDVSPYSRAIYPFCFTLEPVTLDSLAKYVIAESPSELPSELTEADRELLDQIRIDATRANGGQQVRHIGLIFARLEYLFSDGLADDDIRLDTFALQAKFPDWGYEPRAGGPGEPLIVASFADPDVAGAWPPERIATFRQWIADGSLP